MSRYLKQVDTGRIYPYSDHIADRADMVEYIPKEGELASKAPVQAAAQEAPVVEGEEVKENPDDATIAAIQAVTTLEELATFRVSERSDAVENAINKKGMELVMAGVTPVVAAPGQEEDPEVVAARIAKIKEAIAAIPVEQYAQPTMGRPALPKVGDVSEKAGFKVTVEEVMMAMPQG